MTSHTDPNFVPDWFQALIAELVAAQPGWPASLATIRTFWSALRNYDQDDLAVAVRALVRTTRRWPVPADIIALIPESQARLTAADAWEEMRRNRRRYSPYASHEQNARITWSSDLVKRAADAVGWTDMDWTAEQVPTIRAQFERYYNSLSTKKTELMATSDARVSLLEERLCKRMPQLYGTDYRDPLPEVAP